MNPDLLDSAAIGLQFFSPAQEFFRAQSRGYDADMVDAPGVIPGAAHASCNRLQVDSDTGAVDAEVLEPCDSGWLDIGGAPGTVVPARSL